MKKLDSKGRKSEPNGMAKGGLKMGDVVFTADWWGVRTFYRCLFLLFFFAGSTISLLLCLLISIHQPFFYYLIKKLIRNIIHMQF